MSQPHNLDGWARSQDAFRAARDTVRAMADAADRAHADQRSRFTAT
jgi:hypothetical protein